MTELETKINEAIEQARVSLLAVIKAAKLEVFDAIMAIEAEAGRAAAEVERVDEDEALATLEKTALTEDSQAMFAKCNAIVNDVDAKHTAILKTKTEKLEALKAAL